MAKTIVKKGSRSALKTDREPVKVLYIFLLIAYGFITVLTPNLNTLDSNGPKFMTLALLNLVTFIFLFTRKDLKSNPRFFSGFFINAIGVAYTLLMVVSVLSFISAFNKIEAILHFAKVFTTFSAAYLISVLVLAEKRGLLWLSAAMSVLLIYDCISVFSDVQNVILKKGADAIASVKSSYSNKNILASAIFVKIPFALWLLVFQKKWIKFLSSVTILLAMIAVFFMSARAFYLGLFGLTIAMLIYCFALYYQTREKSHLLISGIFAGSLVLSILIFSFIVNTAYPKSPQVRPAVAGNQVSQSERNTGNDAVNPMSIQGRLSSISDPTGSNRFGGWIRSWHVFKQHPLLGVGLGNWKIITLKEENLNKGDYTYQYKAHNDFIETATETGIFGGLLFISIFVLAGWKFFQLLFKKSPPQSVYYFFLPAAGLFCYSFDAFFNFPQDRPEIQALFSLYAGIAVAVSSLALTRKPENHADRETYEFLKMEAPYVGKWVAGLAEKAEGTSSADRMPGWILSGLFFMTLAVSSYFLILNFKSLKLQRIIKQEINAGKLTSKADMFLKGFPFIPNLNVVGEPIAAQKARYLISEKRYDEAISILKKDHSSPYDTRPEYFLAMAYFEKKMPDSAIYYAHRVYEMKPFHFKNISILTNTMQQQGKSDEASIILDKYLVEHKTDVKDPLLAPTYKEAILFASGFYDRAGNPVKALDIVNSGSLSFPADTNMVRQKTYLQRRVALAGNKETVEAALAAFRDKKYQEAVGLLNKLISIYPAYTEAREYRAFSLFFLKEYAKSNEDLDLLIAGGSKRPNLLNLRGVNYYNLGKLDEACKNFRVARDLGDKDGMTNYNRFCGGQTQTQIQLPKPAKK